MMPATATSRAGADGPDAALADGVGVAARGALMRWFGRASTSVKLILIMLVALAPLGLIAILASIESVRVNQRERLAASRAQATESARAVDALLARTAVPLRAAGTALEAGRGDARACRLALDAIDRSDEADIRFTLFTRAGRRVCGARDTAPRRLPDGSAPTLTVAPDGGSVQLAVAAAGNSLVAVARIPRADLAAAARPMTPGDYRLSLGQDGRASTLVSRGRAGDGLSVAAPIANGQARIAYAVPGGHVTVTEMLSILLPLAMLVAASVIAFLVTDRLMLRPLKQLESAVRAYRAGDRTLPIPRLTTPAHEIRSLAAAFRSVSHTIVRHEGELEEGLQRQTRLTREVHHRVKNNLQVVASLLNLHARGARSQEVSDAYAAIQRRVDALAVVHRNHYAEMEDNRGVALRPLLSELAANLRAGAPLPAAAMPILLDLAPLRATQDVAVPVAFIVTELVEAAMLAAPTGRVTIGVQPAGPARALLSVTSDALKDTDAPVTPERQRLERVLTGLSRQLRTPLERDTDEGRVSVEIGVME